jgi:hypothetical protein
LEVKYNHGQPPIESSGGGGYSNQSSGLATIFHQTLNYYVVFFLLPLPTLPATANAWTEAEMLLLKQTIFYVSADHPIMRAFLLAGIISQNVFINIKYHQK